MEATKRRPTTNNISVCSKHAWAEPEPARVRTYVNVWDAFGRCCPEARNIGLLTAKVDQTRLLLSSFSLLSLEKRGCFFIILSPPPFCFDLRRRRRQKSAKKGDVSGRRRLLSLSLSLSLSPLSLRMLPLTTRTTAKEIKKAESSVTG